MVVMIVAAGTVCLLTNLLVLCIILRQRVGRITFRYQVILGQCTAGLISSTVMFYPLKVRSCLVYTVYHWNSQLAIYKASVIKRITHLAYFYQHIAYF